MKKLSNKASHKSLLERAMDLEPKPYISRMGWESYPIEEVLDLAIAYCYHKIGATSLIKTLTGETKSSNAPYIVGKVFEKALHAGLVKRVRPRKSNK